MTSRKTINKADVFQAVLEALRASFELAQHSSKNARAGGNDSESKAEGKYDTRSTEENYLADGLAKQALASLQAAKDFKKLSSSLQEPKSPIDLGALVQMEFQDGTFWFLLGPSAGGLEVLCNGVSVTVITPESPLGSRILGLKAGERISAPAAKITAVY